MDRLFEVRWSFKVQETDRRVRINLYELDG